MVIKHYSEETFTTHFKLYLKLHFKLFSNSFINRNIAIFKYSKKKKMGASKSAAFTEKQNELSILFKALGHPARIAIIEYILSSKSCICGDLVDILPLSQATVSQHLKELKSANIIQGSIEGNSICYCLNPTTLEKFKAIIGDFIELNNFGKNACC